MDTKRDCFMRQWIARAVAFVSANSEAFGFSDFEQSTLKSRTQLFQSSTPQRHYIFVDLRLSKMPREYVEVFPKLITH